MIKNANEDLLDIDDIAYYNCFMSEIQRQEYRDRIKEGQVVYFAGPDNVMGARRERLEDDFIRNPLDAEY